MARRVGNTAELVPTSTVLHRLFDHVVTRWPERIAIEVPPSFDCPERRTVTYQDLKRLSDVLAQRLSHLITTPERIAVILLPRSGEHLYAAQLAVLKSGAAFTCVDVS